MQAARDESAASKEVIALLRRQVDALQKEKETLAELQKADLNEGQLLEILRTKDCQIVDLEARDKEHTKVTELQENQLEKMREEVKTYQHMLEVSYLLHTIVLQWQFVSLCFSSLTSSLPGFSLFFSLLTLSFFLACLPQSPEK